MIPSHLKVLAKASLFSRDEFMMQVVGDHLANEVEATVTGRLSKELQFRVMLEGQDLEGIVLELGHPTNSFGRVVSRVVVANLMIDGRPFTANQISGGAGDYSRWKLFEGHARSLSDGIGV